MMETYSHLDIKTVIPNQEVMYTQKGVTYESQVNTLDGQLVILSNKRRKHNPIIQQVLVQGAVLLGVPSEYYVEEDSTIQKVVGGGVISNTDSTVVDNTEE